MKMKYYYGMYNNTKQKLTNGLLITLIDDINITYKKLK